MNIIIYVLDSLRADHLSCYGYDRETTPNIDGLAKEGIVFENAYSQSTWTRPSAASILTGGYPGFHKTTTRESRLPCEIPVIPELLRDRGFKTAAFSAMGNVSSALGFNRGFDRFYDLFKEKSLVGKRTMSTIDRERLYFESEKEVVLPLAKDINQFFFPYLRSTGKSDFFAFIWSIDTHIPFSAQDGTKRFCSDSESKSWPGEKPNGERNNLIKKAWLRLREEPAQLKSQIRKEIDLYDSEIYYADHHIGKLIEELKRLNIYDETVIIVTADHGEGFSEYGRVSRHGFLPYDEIIRVPLIIKLPDCPEFQEFKGVRRKSVVQLIDLAPTILSLTDGTDEQKFQGRNIMPIIQTDASIINYTFSETRVHEYTSTYLSIRGDGYKYIKTILPEWSLFNIRKDPVHFFGRQFFRRLQGKNRKLYNLDKDPHEKTNVIKLEKKRAEELDVKLTNWSKSNVEVAGTIKADHIAEMDDEVKKHLVALGYVD